MYLYNYFQFPHYKNIYVDIKKEENKKKNNNDGDYPRRYICDYLENYLVKS